MTLGELRQTLARYLGLDTTAADGLVAFWDRDLLNEAMRAINIELIIPRVSAVVSRDALETDPTVNIPDGTDVLQVVAPPDRLVPIVDSEDYAPSEEYLPMQASSGLVAVVSNNPLAVTFMKPTLEEWPESVRSRVSKEVSAHGERNRPALGWAVRGVPRPYPHEGRHGSLARVGPR